MGKIKYRNKIDVLNKFFSLFSFNESGGCWVWNGSFGGSGYGNFYDPFHKKRTTTAHRYSYELLKGPIDEGLTIDHLCRNKKCINPEHLEQVSIRENLIRGTGFIAINVKKTHCPDGHPYDGRNLGVYKGLRHCKMCKRNRIAIWRQKKHDLNRAKAA